MSHLLTTEEKTCPECGEITDEFDIIDAMSIGKCLHCDHIWAARDWKEHLGMINTKLHTSRSAFDTVEEGDIWVQKS